MRFRTCHFLHLRLKTRSLRTQFALGVALLVAALAVSLSLLLGTLMARESKAGESAALYDVAHNAAQMLSDGLALHEREVRILAESPTLWGEGLAAERVRQVLQRSQALNPHHAWIGVTDTQGIVRSATGGLLVGQDVHERAWFQAGRQDVHVGDVHPAKLLAKHLPPGSDGGPQRFVDFAAPIAAVDARGRSVVGVIGIHGSWDWTRATIEMLMPDNADARGLEVFIFDRKGEPIYAAGSTLEALRASGQKLPLRATARQGNEPHAQVRTWTDHRDYLTSAAMVRTNGGPNDLGWTIVARVPVDVAFAAARHSALLALLLGLAAAALASVLGAGLAARLLRPLRSIAKAAQAVEHGATRLPLQTGSVEIEALSGALAAMTDRMVQARAELEQRVADRTAELQHANAELAQMAHHDPLTGLLNRRGLDERLRELVSGARRRGTPVTVLLIDADHFKRINDQFGHDAGDQVLCALADTLRQRLREVDVLARVGGEEFVAVLPDTDAEAACHVASVLLQRIAARTLPGVGHVTVSIGVAPMALDAGAHGQVAHDALRRADTALYCAKASGRNRFVLAALAPGADEQRVEALDSVM